MALLNPTFVFGLVVLLYLSSFVLLAVLRILTGISIQRVGYFSLRRLAYTPRYGCRIEIRGLGINVHRPTFAQPTWLSVVLEELVVTLDFRELEKSKRTESDHEINEDDTHNASLDDKSIPIPRSRPSQRGGKAVIRSETWKKLTQAKEKLKKLHSNINWLKMIDVVATNSSINVVDVGNIQVGSFTLAVDTRPKMVDRARFFMQRKHSPSKDRQAEWIMTVRSVLFTADGGESMELLDHLFLNIHGFLYASKEGLRDASVSLKLGRLHIPLDDIHTCMTKLKQSRKSSGSSDPDEPVDIFLGKVVQGDSEPGSGNEELMRTVSDSREFFSSILRGIKEVQFAVSFLGLTSRVSSVKPGANPIILSAAMKEVGIDLHRLDPKSPAHRMYFPPSAIAHEALGAALSISLGLDDGQGHADRLVYIPMATTTVKTTLLSKTVEVLQETNAGEKNANIMFANSVVTSPSVDLDPRHLPLLLTLLKSKPRAQRPKGENKALISRLLPKATVKFSMHEPVVRIKLKPLQKTEDPDDFDLIISSISSISLDMESSHSLVEDIHYSLDGAVRLQSHDLYYQTNTGDRFNLITTESFDMKVHLGARPDVYVELTGNLQSASVSMVRPEIIDGVRQIVRELRIDVEAERAPTARRSRNKNFLRSMPSWLLRSQIEMIDFSVEVAGIDEDISDDTRGVFLHWDNVAAEYRAHRFDGLHRRQSTSRRRANSRSMTQSDSDFTPSPNSPRHRKKPQNIGDGRRLTIHARGIEAQIMEDMDRLEPEPFVSIPFLEASLSATSDSHGPLFNIHTSVRTITAQYSLYRHYAVGVAVMTLSKAFLRSSRDLPRRKSESSVSSLSPPSSRLAPPGAHDDLSGLTTITSELVTFDFKAALVQLKAEMPHDPAMMLHMYGLEFGRQRWSTPHVAARLVRLYTEPPRMRNVWARIVSIKSGRLDFRESKRKTQKGPAVDEKMIDIVTEAVRIAIPHEVIVSRISDNFINVIKAVQQLHHRFKTGTNEYILEKRPEGPKTVPKISIRARNFLFELEDGAFEWKLGMIYRTGRLEQAQRIVREEAFRVKLKRVREEEIRRGSSKIRSRSTFTRGRPDASSTASNRSRSVDALNSPTEGHSGGRSGKLPRYDPDSESIGVNGHSKVSEHDARLHLDMFNAQSWKKRIDRAYEICQNNIKESKNQFWGPNQLPDDIEEAENILEVPPRPALMCTAITDLHFSIDKPTFPMKDLPDFIHKIGKGMPKDMKYSLLVPMHVSIEMGEAKATLRDYPLPLVHFPPMKVGQSSKLQTVSLKANFVIAEEFRGVESTRRVRVNVIPPRGVDPMSHEGSFAIEVRRTIGPVKSYSDVYMNVNTSLPTRITWGPSYQSAIQDMMMVIESFTKPQLDPSERVGFWDKLRLNFHSRIHAAWKGDGDVHLGLKGTRDPYRLTGNGAGFLMCWRNDVRWNINADDDPKRFIAIESSEYVLAIPDYSHEVRETARQYLDIEKTTNEDKFKSEASFKKVVMKLSGKVQFLGGLIFERAIEDGLRSFDFKPHYEVVLKNPIFAKAENGLPYDAMRGFRSRHIHLSIAVRAPVDRDWLSENPEPSRSYNTVHLTPRFFTHFFAWWGLFGQPLSLPIRQGNLFPGREKNSKKFGRHLATVKYNLLLAPLFLSHIYKHKDVDDYAENAVSATGVKVRFDSFSLDLHQRREEFNTLGKTRNDETARTSGIKIHAAQLDLVSADVRAVSASLKGTTTEAIQKGSIATLMNDHDDKPDLSRFTIPDNDYSWIDMDDFVELDWILPTEPHSDTKILPLAYAPRLTYFRQTDIGGVIAGDPSRTSPFGNEPTHFCILNHDNDPLRVQGQLIQERLNQLGIQMQTHARDVGEAELQGIRTDWKDPEIVHNFEALRKHTHVLREKKEFLESMLAQRQAKPSWSSQRRNSDRRRSVGSVGMHDETMHIPATTEFESEFNNRFIIHNLQLKWNNLLRNIILRYFHQNGQRRGFVYYLSRPAIKFILDIVEEQNKAKANGKPKSTHSGHGGGTSTKAQSVDESDDPQDIEDRIKKILGEGRKFTSATWSSNADNEIEGSIEDLVYGIAEEFTPQNSYHIRIIAPQIQLQSDKNKKHVVLATAKGMELKVVEVMDSERISDTVSGLVQRRFLVNMDSVQFFVTHQKWFLTNLLSMYVGSKYGTANGSSWPPWVPIEVVFDFQADPFGFKRVVQKTSAQVRYDKYNTLRLKYNDEVNTDGPNETSQDSSTENRMDNLWVEFPQARALCNSSQYYALYVIVLDLLMYNEPMEKTRSERLEKIILASDFSDLSGAPAKVQKLQQRIRNMEDIKGHFQMYTKYLDKKGWEDRLRLERDIAACEDELFFLMKAITSSQRKFDVNTNTTGLLRWNISVRDIVWHLMQDSNEPLVELQLKDLDYDRTDNSDGSHVNLIRVGKVLGLNLLPDATYPEMVAPFIDTEKPLGPDMENKEMIRVYWYMLEAIAGIPVMDRFEVNVLPIKVQLEHELGRRLFEYIFPGLDGEKLAGDNTKNDSPFIIKQMDAEDEYEESVPSTNDRSESSSFDKDSSSFSTRPGSLELRLRPTLSSSAKSDRSSKKALSINSGEGHSFRLFRAPTPRTMLKKPSRESLRSSSTHRNALARTSTGHSSRDAQSIASTDKRANRFGLSKKADDKEQPSDDLTKMMTRASHFMTFSSIKMPSVVLCLSYKGKEQRNFADVHDFVFRMPSVEWQNKTWSNLDLALALKKAVMKALISHTGALIGNKFSKHRPNAEQRNKLRELANSSVLIAPSSSAASQHHPGSINDSDDSSSMYGTSPVDFSRSPPRSLRGSTHSSIPASNSSRRRSRSSSVTSRKSSRTTASGVPGPNIPTYLMMTPPTPVDDPRGRQNHGIELLRPGTSSGFSMAPSTQNPQTLRRGTPIERPQTSMSGYDSGVKRKNGTSNLKDKLSALTFRMSHRDSNGAQDDETERDDDHRPPSRDSRSRRLSWNGGKSR